MKLGYIGMPNAASHFMAHEQLQFADHLGFGQVYFPNQKPEPLLSALKLPTNAVKIALDAKAFGTACPSKIGDAVRHTNDRLGGHLSLGIDMTGADACPASKAKSQAFETLFSYNSPVEHVIPTSKFPMRSPRPDIIGLPITGASDEARLSAARGYAPMTPSWVSQKEAARVWPAIVHGATSAIRRAQPAHWQINRMVVIHDDAATLDSYIYGSNSPFRRYFAKLVQKGILKTDIDTHIQQVVIAGSHRKVAEEILALRETIGEFGTLNIVAPTGSDPNMTQTTMIGLATNVLPMVATSNMSPNKNLENT